MSFGVGRLEGLEDVESEGMSLLYASQIMKRAAINASAWYPCVCKICVDLSCLILGHSIHTLLTSNTSVSLTLSRCTGFGELQIICMSIFKNPRVRGGGEAQGTTSVS